MKTKKLLPLALLPIGIIPSITISCSTHLYTFEAEGLKIRSDGEITGFVSKNTHVGPLEIKEEYNGIVITNIGDYAFQNEQIEGLILPKTLTKISDGAFQNIKSPVKKTENISTPWDLSHLTNLEYIGDKAFKMGIDETRNLNIDLNLSGLTKLTEIGFTAFQRLGLTSVNFKGVNNLKNIGGSAFVDNSITGELDLTDLTNLTSIEIMAFYNNKISSIIWPRSSQIKNIDRHAFKGNAITGELNLSSLINLKSIGHSVFESNQISSIIWPTDSQNQINNIDESAFSRNSITGELNLSSLINLKSIGSHAFSRNKISSIIWPTDSQNQINNIDESAFDMNSITGELNLSSLINLTSIGREAFRFNQISSIIWPRNSQINSIGLGAFASNKFGTNIPKFPPGLTTEINGGISLEQIFKRVKKLSSTN